MISPSFLAGCCVRRASNHHASMGFIKGSTVEVRSRVGRLALARECRERGWVSAPTRSLRRDTFGCLHRPPSPRPVVPGLRKADAGRNSWFLQLTVEEGQLFYTAHLCLVENTLSPLSSNWKSGTLLKTSEMSLTSKVRLSQPSDVGLLVFILFIGRRSVCCLFRSFPAFWLLFLTEFVFGKKSWGIRNRVFFTWPAWS